MWQVLERLKLNILKLRKRRVADENGIGADRTGVLEQNLARRQGKWTGFAVLHRVVQAPVGLLSCVSGSYCALEMTSERDYIMVHDGMQYAVFL